MGELEKEQQKLARNRESARNSRKRKKIYQELLENKVANLSKFLQESQKICTSSQSMLQNLQKQITYKNEINNSKAILFQNLQATVENNAIETNINQIIDQIRKQFGASNSERMMILDYCFKQISEQILPIHMQYILYAVLENKDIFEETQLNQPPIK